MPRLDIALRAAHESFDVDVVGMKGGAATEWNSVNWDVSGSDATEADLESPTVPNEPIDAELLRMTEVKTSCGNDDAAAITGRSDLVELLRDNSTECATGVGETES
jgi:hypothetical protein